MKNNKCIGITGAVFGHKYKTIYDRKPNPPSAEEAQKMVKLITTDLTPMYTYSSGLPMTHSLETRNSEIANYNRKVLSIISGEGKETITPLYEICTRCGHKLIK